MDPASSNDAPLLFNIISTRGEARCGSLTTRGRKLDTPCFLVHTAKGSPQNFTPDIVNQIGLIQGLQVDISDLCVSINLFLARLASPK
jgi:hypothetical protein